MEKRKGGSEERTMYAFAIGSAKLDGISDKCAQKV